MKNGGTIRILIALALIGAIFSGGSDPKPKPEPVPCGGGLHRPDDWAAPD